MTAFLAGCAGGGPMPSPVPVEASAGPTPIGTSAPAVSDAPSDSPNATAAACVAPVTVAGLGGWPGSPPIDRILSCFGHRDFVVTGYLAPPWGIGGLGNGVVPSWLGEWDGLDAVLWEQPRLSDRCPSETGCLWMFIHASNAAIVPLSPERWVTLTGHFDDPLASTCRATGQGGDAVTSDAEAIATCRRHFVVTEIRTVPPPAS